MLKPQAQIMLEDYGAKFADEFSNSAAEVCWYHNEDNSRADNPRTDSDDAIRHSLTHSRVVP